MCRDAVISVNGTHNFLSPQTLLSAPAGDGQPISLGETRTQSVLVLGAAVTCVGAPDPGSRASPSNTGGLCFLCSQALSCLRRKLCQVWRTHLESQHLRGPSWQEASLCFPGRLSLNKREKNKKQRGLKESSQDSEKEIEDCII